MTRILQITDTHIMDEGVLAYGVVDTARYLTAALDYLDQIRPQIAPIDAVIFTGDLIDSGTASEYLHFKRLTARLDLPVLAIPGNHDARGPMRAALGLAGQADAPINWWRDFGDMVLAGLDSIVPGGPEGALGAAALAVLDEALAAADGRPVLVALHHPPFHTGIRMMDGMNLLDPSGLIGRIDAYPGELRVICGHVHRQIAGQAGRRVALIAPSVAHAVLLDHREDPPPDFIMEPAGMVLHDLKAGFVSSLIPVGPHPGPYSFWPDGRD